jgi:hypothetical protein
MNKTRFVMKVLPVRANSHRTAYAQRTLFPALTLSSSFAKPSRLKVVLTSEGPLVTITRTSPLLLLLLVEAGPCCSGCILLSAVGDIRGRTCKTRREGGDRIKLETRKFTFINHNTDPVLQQMHCAEPPNYIPRKRP